MNIRTTVQNASKVALLKPLSVVGNNEYKLSTDFICWDEINQYCLSSIYQNFGQTVTPSTFACGSAAISAFDLGLLYSVFTSMHSAYIEEGGAIKTDFISNADNIHVSWMGKHCVIHSAGTNIIIPITSSDMNAIVANGRKLCMRNFADRREFYVSVTGTSMTLDNSDGTHFTSTNLPEYILRLYSDFLDKKSSAVSTVNEFWDDDSMLGNLIANSRDCSDIEQAFSVYQNKTTVDSVVVRNDLIFEPSKRFQSTEEFLGSLCYTDNDTVVLAVNCRNNMFVHCKWFSGVENPPLAVMMSPNFNSFFNVNEECELVTVFANTVGTVPPSPAEMTIEVFEKIRDAFLRTELPRVQLQSAFGHVVIPEPFLVHALIHNSWDTLNPILPVGKIGKSIICKSFTGTLASYNVSSVVNPNDYVWGEGDYFYDISKVVG